MDIEKLKTLVRDNPVQAAAGALPVLLIAHAAVNLVGTCLQLSSQSLPARLHFKGSGIFYQLFFMQQLGDIRRSHAVLDNNKS